MRKVKLFSLYDTNSLFYKIGMEINQEINKWPQEYFAEDQIEGCVKNLRTEKALSIPEIHFEKSESKTSSKIFSNAVLRPGSASDMKIKVNVIEYRIPFEGDANLLACTVSSNQGFKSEEWTVDTKTGELAIEYAVYGKTSKTIIHEHKNYVTDLMQQQNDLKAELLKFNAGLENMIRQVVEKRKAEIKSQNSLLSSLGLKS
ncbi:hypothetical protein [Dyadobacter sediminis]|uniref:Uncharacterized protein n=1 Tax=Dyadobacter sediminis TaxID=1493691 RepID=A0A5R9KKQ0_9BACT|nr:hypothetical protein [Dyadobacter sediminis]TLU96801.1 hypothetical protein FEM55_06660 [Dyadobacter sediminis]GGB85264.1 hypothetical protein GCM10011325_11070 [Dyadobacter sediminis]